MINIDAGPDEVLAAVQGKSSSTVSGTLKREQAHDEGHPGCHASAIHLPDAPSAPYSLSGKRYEIGLQSGAGSIGNRFGGPREHREGARNFPTLHLSCRPVKVTSRGPFATPECATPFST